MIKKIAIALAVVFIITLPLLFIILERSEEEKAVAVISYLEEFTVPEPEFNKSELEKIINKYTKRTNEKWGVYIEALGKDFIYEDNSSPVIAASVIKLYNMAAFYNEVSKGNIIPSARDLDQLRLMITVSSNGASNYIVSRIGNGNFSEGAKKVTDFAHSIGCAETKEEHMLFDTAASVTGRNRISAKDCGLILNKLYNNELISPEYDRKMLELLKAQEVNYKIPAHLPKDTVIAHKTGENSKVQHDVGIVYSPCCDYIICITVSEFGGRPVISDIKKLSSEIYTFFNP